MGYLDGFRVTFKKMFEKRLTLPYAKDEGGKRDKPRRLHGRHVLNRYEDGSEKCIGCELCAAVCPADCIYVRGADNPPEDPVSPGERYGYIYEINYLRCIHCDLCVEACPTEAITESKLFEFSFTNRADAIYTKAELVVDDDGRPRQLPWEDWSDLVDVEPYTSEWMRATSPSGAAELEGVLSWAGELGYGVRPAEQGQAGETSVASDRSDDLAPADVKSERSRSGSSRTDDLAAPNSPSEESRFEGASGGGALPDADDDEDSASTEEAQ